ncbi:MAG TPA: hypothetical protein DCY88_16220 [Cyanobacteria bacterium UBA11372]|nr:hypothetical protein [Cyanobacteria bacterium UBA11372]
MALHSVKAIAVASTIDNYGGLRRGIQPLEQCARTLLQATQDKDLTYAKLSVFYESQSAIKGSDIPLLGWENPKG